MHQANAPTSGPHVPKEVPKATRGGSNLGLFRGQPTSYGSHVITGELSGLNVQLEHFILLLGLCGARLQHEVVSQSSAPNWAQLR